MRAALLCSLKYIVPMGDLLLLTQVCTACNHHKLCSASDAVLLSQETSYPWGI